MNKPKKPTRPTRPTISNGVKWQAFITSHTPIYVGGFAKKTPFGNGISLSIAVKNSMNLIAKGSWEWTTLKIGNEKIVIVGFVDKADFDAAKLKHKGQPWTSHPVTVPVVDAFSVALP